MCIAPHRPYLDRQDKKAVELVYCILLNYLIFKSMLILVEPLVCLELLT